MNKETSDKIFTKVANQDKAVRVLGGIVASNKRAKAKAVISGVLSKHASHNKTAGPKGEIGSMFAWNLLPYIGAVGNAIGGHAGSIDNPATEADEKAWDKDPNYHLGVGAYRFNRRLKRQLKDDKGGAKHYLAMNFGPWTNMLAATLAGGTLGGVAGAFPKNNPDSISKGFNIGASIGGGAALLANLIGAGSAAFTKRRTKEEQKAYANSPTLSEYFVPGKAPYNMWKSVGRSIGDSEEREAKENKKEEKA